MGNFKFIPSEIEGLFVIEPVPYIDARGYFMETFNYRDFSSMGLNLNFVQDNQSKSKKGVLRGLHFQLNHPQGKLVRVISGEVFDVAVDLRPESKTYKKWQAVYLSSENKKQFYIPPGFAHGFLVISDEAEFVYKCTDYYNKDDESGLIWNDPDIAIDWPIDGLDISLSEKDSKWVTLREFNLFKEEQKYGTEVFI